MILADKIMQLRKKNGWSQEELAEKLNVSRQSVSKWEGAISVPDLDKILKLGQIFGVSTDYLLKDEISDEDIEYVDSNDEIQIRTISVAEANEFMTLNASIAKRFSLAVSACILSPVVLILLYALADSQISGVSETLAGLVGLLTLLLMVAAAVAVFIINGYKLEQYKYITESSFELGYGVSGIVEEKKKKFESTFITCLVIGVVLCICSVIPLISAAMLNTSNLIIIICVDILLIIVAIAVHLFIRVGMIRESYEQLLQTGDYTRKAKKKNKVIDRIGGAYWSIVAAIYLVWSFITMDWGKTWIIWPCAGVLFGAITAIVGSTEAKDEN
ncbi:MAG: helix-turn-helix domain-containing protein [Lachnospiraceae bacterium]